MKGFLIVLPDLAMESLLFSFHFNLESLFTPNSKGVLDIPDLGFYNFRRRNGKTFLTELSDSYVFCPNFLGEIKDM